MSVPGQKVSAAMPPTASITNVTSNTNYQIDVTVRLTLEEFTFDYYIDEVRLYLNQSEATILANNYGDFNASDDIQRKTSETFNHHILSPQLAEGDGDSAIYNITVVALTSTGVKSALATWAGGYYFLDAESPVVTIINPSPNEEVWGKYTVTAQVDDFSGISKVEFYVDDIYQAMYSLDNITVGQTTFTWDWISSELTRGVNHYVKVVATDNSSSYNVGEKRHTVKVIGPEMSLISPVPEFIDFNDTLIVNVTATVYNVSLSIASVQVNYYINNTLNWQTGIFSNDTIDEFYFVFPGFPIDGQIGASLTFEILVNNTLGHYHIFRDTNLAYYRVTTEHWDHISPTGFVTYENLITEGDKISIRANITEQSPISSIMLYYRKNLENWITTDMNLIDSNVTTFLYEYNFTEIFPKFTEIRFYIWLNDSGSNKLVLNNAGENYRVKVLPTDLTAPNITISNMPETVITGQNVSITVTVEDNSTITSVTAHYLLAGREYSFAMINTEGNIWSISFRIDGATGDKVRIWVEAIDENFNTAETNSVELTIQSERTAGGHSNAWLWLMFIGLIILPVVLTVVLLKPNK
jgi:hypothetical protein